VAVVLVDGENVRRSLWPNLAYTELERRAAAWGERERHEVRVVWEPADDRIAATAQELAAAGTPVWVVTSDRGLKARLPGADRIIGGGSFARSL
jgi:rRNA-processing protein FCF1